MEERTEFEKELEALINLHSEENSSNTPDFILAQFLLACLAAWNAGVQQRETWYGRGYSIAGPNVAFAGVDEPGRISRPSSADSKPTRPDIRPAVATEPLDSI